jgi:hypothetical protein
VYDTGAVIVVGTKVTVTGSIGKVEKTQSICISILTFKYIKNDILCGDFVTRLQKGPEGRYLSTIPKKLVEAKGWEKGMDMAFLIIGPNVNPRDGDVIMRPSGV